MRLTLSDFLREPGGAHKKSSVDEEPGSEKAVSVPPAAVTGTPGHGVAEQMPGSSVQLLREDSEGELLPAIKFNLSKATDQIRRAMDPGTILGEQFRILRTRLSLLQKQNGMRTVLITSTLPNEGKSFMSYALAGVFAQERDKRVLVIDSDLRKQGSGRDYGLTLDIDVPGTTQVLQGEAEVRKSLLKCVDPEFWFLPSGTLSPNPSELLSSSEMEKVLRFAAGKFDWVIVDSPPALALSDPCLMAPLCDAVLFVVRANSTPAKLVNEGINKVGRERICGVVLNRKKQMHSSRRYYQYYYQNRK